MLLKTSYDFRYTVGCAYATTCKWIEFCIGEDWNCGPLLYSTVSNIFHQYFHLPFCGMYTLVDMLQCRGRAALRVKAEKRMLLLRGRVDDPSYNLLPVPFLSPYPTHQLTKHWRIGTAGHAASGSLFVESYINKNKTATKTKNADIAPGKKELILAPEATSKQLMPSNLQLKGWWQETRIHQPTNFLDTLVFHELGPLTNRPAFQLVFNRLSGLLLICWQVHALQQGPHSVPILGRARVVHRS